MSTAYIAAFDVGTTALKGILAAPDGTIAAACSRSIPTLFEGGFQEQDPRSWWNAFRSISLELTCQVPAEYIAAIAMSGQMQDLIPLDRDLQPTGNAILYSDGRAEIQARQLEQTVGTDRFLSITGNRCDGSLPLPKLMWLRQERPEQYTKTAHILISSKDYLIARLTGVCCGDATACSTAGAMDIHEKTWSAPLLAAAGAAPTLFPPLLLPHQQAGQVLSGCDCGYLPGTPVFAGIGDAGALLRASVPGSHGVFFLPYLNGERFPVLDPDIRGAYLGLTPETAPADLARAALEWVAFSLRQGFDQLDAAPSGADTIPLIGGGSQEPVWYQLLADVLDHELLVFRDGEYLSCLAVAAAARLGLGELSSYRDFTHSLRSRELGVTVSPNPEAAALYARRYREYAKIYPALKGVL